MDSGPRDHRFDLGSDARRAYTSPAKGKTCGTGMLLDKIEKLTESQKLIMDSLKVRPGSDGLAPVSLVDVSPCSHCLKYTTPF